MKIKIFKLSFILFFILFLCGCSFKDKIKWLDDKIGEGFEDFKDIDDSDNCREVTEEKLDFNNLTKEQKEKIDQWLEEKGLNRYGDTEGTFYSGGTPLFNEGTEEKLDRYEYIFKNHPELSGEIKNL